MLNLTQVVQLLWLGAGASNGTGGTYHYTKEPWSPDHVHSKP